MNETQKFYDQLSDRYHLIFADWDASVQRQAAILDRLIRRRVKADQLSALDCACGIGTQSLALAMKGHDVLGTDLSPAAVERAVREAERWQLSARFRVGDMRRLDLVTKEVFDVVVCLDNSLPHLLSDADITQALYSMRGRLKPGGLLLASIRDYDALAKERPRSTPIAVYGSAPQRRAIFQLWEWPADGMWYDFTLFILEESTPGWEVFNSAARYRAWQRQELSRFVENVGFQEVQWQMPDESGFYQPVITAVKGV